LPDTTLIAIVDDSITAKSLTNEVRNEIIAVGSQADRIFVTFADQDYYLWNALPQ
jgi:hypothetical protein